MLQIIRFQHITLVLSELHWLPIQYRVIFKILLLVYKSLNGTSLIYLARKIHDCSRTRSLRSVDSELVILRPMGTEQSLFMCKENGTKYFTKFESLHVTSTGVSKDHLRLTCLLNLRNNRFLF